MDWIEHPSPSNFFFFAFFGRDLIFLRTPSSVLTRPESLLRENTSSLGRSGGGEGKDGIVIIFPHESDATPTCLSLNPFVVVFSYSSTRRILQTNGKTSPADHPIFISRHPSFLLSHPNPLPPSSIILPHEKTLSFFHYYSTPPQFILPPKKKIIKKNEPSRPRARRNIHHISNCLRAEFARGDGRIKRKEDERRKKILPNDTLFVVNFHEETTKREDLQMLFEPYGELVRIDMKRNYAFVQFKSIDDAQRARDATNGGKLDQSEITVEFVARTAPPGGGVGGDRGGGGRDDRRGAGGGGRRFDDRGECGGSDIFRFAPFWRYFSRLHALY